MRDCRLWGWCWWKRLLADPHPADPARVPPVPTKAQKKGQRNPDEHLFFSILVTLTCFRSNKIKQSLILTFSPLIKEITFRSCILYLLGIPLSKIKIVPWFHSCVLPSHVFSVFHEFISLVLDFAIFWSLSGLNDHFVFDFRLFHPAVGTTKLIYIQ